jgi:uncharacterized membrane protein YjgN (DUF898 family)
MDGANLTSAEHPWQAYPQAGPSLRPVEFVSEGSRFLKLLIRGAALQLVTFGFYRFWLATDIRRHLWSHTLVDGENAEYTGTGRELLVGFLFALAILLPIYLGYFLIGIEAERLQAFASVPLGLFMVLFGYFALYRARRYRMTRTIWRGVRFWMQGSGWKFAFLAFGWGILVILSLGAAYPWRAAALERYKMNNTFYGDMQGAFDARPSDLFKQGIGMWLFAVAVLVTLIAAGITQMLGAKTISGILLFFGILGAIIVPFLYPFFKALEWRWWASGVSFSGTRLSCNLRGGSLLGLFFKYLFIASLVTGAVSTLLIAVGAAVMEVAGLSIKSIEPKSLNDFMSANGILFIGGIVFTYLTILLTLGVVQRFFLQHEYWKLITSTLTVIKPESMEDVAAKGKIANALGEGLADGFDVAGF